MWILFALYVSLATAAMSEVNRLFKMDGYRLNFWRTTLVSVWVMPAAFFIDWPTQTAFYLVGFLVGISMFISSSILLNLAAAGRGRASQLHLLLKAFLVFGLWLTVDVVARDRIMGDLLRSGLILFSFGLATLSVQLIRRNDTGLAVLMAIVPVVLFGTASDVLIKVVMPAHVIDVGAAIGLAWLANLTCAILTGIYLATQPKKRFHKTPLLPPKMMRAALAVALCGFPAFIAANLAIALAPNPAYPGVLLFLTPFWLQLWHKIRGVPDDANPWASALLVLSAMLLIYAANFL